MEWIFDFVAPDEFPEIAAATGAMLFGRRTYEVAKDMDARDTEYPFSGPQFVVTHQLPDVPDTAVTFLTGDIGQAVATALDAAGGKNLEILGADVARQCLQRGLVDEILVYVLPVLLGDGIPFYSSPGTARIELEMIYSTRWGGRLHPALPRPQTGIRGIAAGYAQWTVDDITAISRRLGDAFRAVQCCRLRRNVVKFAHIDSSRMSSGSTASTTRACPSQLLTPERFGVPDPGNTKANA